MHELMQYDTSAWHLNAGNSNTTDISFHTVQACNEAGKYWSKTFHHKNKLFSNDATKYTVHKLAGKQYILTISRMFEASVLSVSHLDDPE